MTDASIRLDHVFRTVNRVIDQHVDGPPVNMTQLCRAFGARLITFTQAVDAGMDPYALVDCLGNRDGVAMESPRSWAIIFDKKAPINRLRFTLGEELMHHLLGHTKDPDFCWHAQRYSAKKYEQYEREAKLAASLLLVPPSVYYKNRGWFSSADIARVCGVSASCMARAVAWYDADEQAIRSMFTKKDLSPPGLVRRDVLSLQHGDMVAGAWV